MRRATPAEEGPIRAAMAAHAVVVREVFVLPGAAAAAWAPVRGRMRVREGFLCAPAWRRAAIIAHEAGHVRLRHLPRCVALAATTEAALLAARVALAPALLSGPLAFGLGTAGILAGEVAVWASVSWLMRIQEYAADRWAVRDGGVTGGEYVEHLRQVGHPAARGPLDRLIETHPTPAQRIRRI